MKKILAFLLAGCLALSLTACGQEPADQTDPAEETVYPACFDGMEDLIAAARAEGALTVYGSCEESYLAAACQHFQELFGITVTYQRTAAGADVWFGGSAENCRAAAEAGQLMAYSAANAVHLTDSAYRDDDGYWYGIRRSVLGFIVDSSMLRRMEIDAPADWADLLELPEKIVEDVPVVLDTKAAAAYKTMEKKCLLQVDGEAITAQQAASLTNKLLQLCNGSLYDDDGQMHQIHRCKLDAFDELIDQLDGQKALVFYHFRFDEEQLVKTLKHNHSGLRVAVLRDNRDAAAWNAGEIDVLLAQPASCAYGLNLQQGGHHLIWYSMPWSLELYAQGEARLYRQGQKQSVIVHRLIVKHGADELVVKALNSKDRNQNALMQALKSYIKERG